MPEPVDPKTTYLHLRDDLAVHPVPVGPDFWATIQNRTDLHGGRLLMRFDFSSDWRSWEVHPAGDELVILLSGAIDLRLRLPDGEATVALREPGQVAVVPRGVWHTADVAEAASALFLTPGEGTQNEPR